MEKITISELCKKVEQEIIPISSLTKFYIGKTEDVQERENTHAREGYKKIYCCPVKLFERNTN